jgi:hypothetical protein
MAVGCAVAEHIGVTEAAAWISLPGGDPTGPRFLVT